MMRMTKLVAIKSFRQTPGFCGPACLKMIFEYNGVLVSEGAIAKTGNVKRTIGMSLESMKKAAKHFGFRLRSQDNATFADIQKLLKKGVPPMVDWFSEDDGHYSVVVGLDAKKIYLQDPEWGKVHPIDRQTFFRCWFDFPKDYLHDASEIILRRLIVVESLKN